MGHEAMPAHLFIYYTPYTKNLRGELSQLEQKINVYKKTSVVAAFFNNKSPVVDYSS